MANDYFSVERASAAIQKTWAERPRVADCCVAILSFLISPPAKRYISLGMLQSAAGVSAGEHRKDFAMAVQYLLGDSVRVLALNFEIVDAEGFPRSLTAEDAECARTERINPLSGEHDDRVDEKIITYFRPSEYLESALSTGAGN